MFFFFLNWEPSVSVYLLPPYQTVFLPSVYLFRPNIFMGVSHRCWCIYSRMSQWLPFIHVYSCPPVRNCFQVLWVFAPLAPELTSIGAAVQMMQPLFWARFVYFVRWSVSCFRWNIDPALLSRVIYPEDTCNKWIPGSYHGGTFLCCWPLKQKNCLSCFFLFFVWCLWPYWAENYSVFFIQSLPDLCAECARLHSRTFTCVHRNTVPKGAAAFTVPWFAKWFVSSRTPV